MNALTADMERLPAAFSVKGADRPARLHVVRYDPLIDDADQDRVSGPSERGVGLRLVADMGVVGDIARRARKDLNRARLDCRSRIDHGREGFPLDPERLSAVARGKRRVCDDHRDDIADVMGFFARHDRIGLQRRQCAIRIGHRRQAGNCAKRGEVRSGQDHPHSRDCKRGGSIGDAKARVSVRAADEYCVEGTFGRNV